MILVLPLRKFKELPFTSPDSSRFNILAVASMKVPVMIAYCRVGINKKILLCEKNSDNLNFNV